MITIILEQLLNQKKKIPLKNCVRFASLVTEITNTQYVKRKGL